MPTKAVPLTHEAFRPRLASRGALMVALFRGAGGPHELSGSWRCRWSPSRHQPVRLESDAAGLECDSSGRELCDRSSRTVRSGGNPTTSLFVVESVSLQIVAGIGHRPLLRSHRLAGMGIIRTLFLAPMMIAPVFAGMIWRLVPVG